VPQHPVSINLTKLHEKEEKRPSALDVIYLTGYRQSQTGYANFIGQIPLLAIQSSSFRGTRINI